MLNFQTSKKIKSVSFQLRNMLLGGIAWLCLANVAFAQQSGLTLMADPAQYNYSTQSIEFSIAHDPFSSQMQVTKPNGQVIYGHQFQNLCDSYQYVGSLGAQVCKITHQIQASEMGDSVTLSVLPLTGGGTTQTISSIPPSDPKAILTPLNNVIKNYVKGGVSAFFAHTSLDDKAGLTYDWTLSSGLNLDYSTPNSDRITVTAQNPTTGTVTVEVTDSDGHIDTATQQVEFLALETSPLDKNNIASIFNITDTNNVIKIKLNETALTQIFANYLSDIQTRNQFSNSLSTLIPWNVSTGFRILNFKNGMLTEIDSQTLIAGPVLPAEWAVNSGDEFKQFWQTDIVHSGTNPILIGTETFNDVNMAHYNIDLHFRFPANYTPDTLNITRPMEIWENGVVVNTVNVSKVNTASATNIGSTAPNIGGTVDPLDPSTTIAVGGVVTNTGGNNRVSGTGGIDGVISRTGKPVISSPSTATVRVPIRPAVKIPAPTQLDQDKVEPPKEEPKNRRVLPWRR